MDGMNDKLAVIGQSTRHDSALAHCTGEARFTDDIPELPGTLHAALVLSDIAHARLHGLNTATAASMPGVVAIIGPQDIPGHNDVSPTHRGGEPLFADTEILHWGQALAMVVATSRDAALLAARAVTAEVEVLRPVLSVDEALAANDLLMAPMVMTTGDYAKALAASPHRLSGEFRCGGQEHFYLEGQICLAIPGEDGDLALHSSTQHPTEVQHIAAGILGCDFNRISVHVRRLGGGFGGKESNASWIGAAAALAAVKTGRPVKLRLPRKTDMAVTGKRHPFLFRWDVGFDDTGRILGLDALMAADGGHTLDLSTGVIFRAVTHALNVMAVPDIRIDGRVLRTNTVSNTAFRGFGGPQGVVLSEEIIRRIARAIGSTPEVVRERNFAGEANGSFTPYGQKLEGDLISRVWAETKDLSGWDSRRAAVDAFNASHPYKRRGLGSFVLSFGISFGVQSMNQAGALVHVYADGSIRLNHGGTEMGQGLFIKIAQVVAETFGVPLSRVRITATSTAEVPNTSPTAASTGTDLNGWAARIAAGALRERMVKVAAEHWAVEEAEIEMVDDEVRAGNHRMSFGELAKLCHAKRVSLSATGHYKTPGLSWDPATMRGEPFFYFTYAAAVAEVEVDSLTGEHRCLGAWLVEDCGRSLNPAVDLGQIEGAFVQGMGWLTSEELFWDTQGRLRTLGPSTYKIPGSRDVPEVFEVRLLSDAPARADTIFRSKAVGEPPLMLATCVWNALIDAAGVESLDMPVTPERLLMAMNSK